MKVLKFGGSSVATLENIRQVRSILESQEEIVVVVSALGGVTDELVEISKLAENADASYLEKLQALKKRHIDICDALMDTAKSGKFLRLAVDALLNELDSICRGVFLLKVLPAKTRDQILSFGERLSSLIITAAVGNAELYDSLDFIRMDGGLVDFSHTNKLVKERFAGYGPGSPIAIVPGFIARDLSGDIVTLGRAVRIIPPVSWPLRWMPPFLKYGRMWTASCLRIRRSSRLPTLLMS